MLTAQNVEFTMRNITFALGVEMVRDINAKFGDGKTHVTCWRCHRASTTPQLAKTILQPEHFQSFRKARRGAGASALPPTFWSARTVVTCTAARRALQTFQKCPEIAAALDRKPALHRSNLSGVGPHF